MKEYFFRTSGRCESDEFRVSAHNISKLLAGACTIPGTIYADIWSTLYYAINGECPNRCVCAQPDLLFFIFIDGSVDIGKTITTREHPAMKAIGNYPKTIPKANA